MDKDSIFPDVKSNFILKNNYKTKICENFYQNGTCKFGSNCFFIHPFQDRLYQEIKDVKIAKHIANLQT